MELGCQKFQQIKLKNNTRNNLCYYFSVGGWKAITLENVAIFFSEKKNIYKKPINISLKEYFYIAILTVNQL